MFFMIAVLGFSSCTKEYVETEPTEFLPGETLISDVASAESALIGMYSAVQLAYVYGGYDTFFTGLYADELIHIGSFPSFAEFGVNDVSINNIDLTSYWTDHYAAIYRANLVIQGAQDPSLELSEDAVKRIVGQARGVRALMYYNLVKRFGGVPLATAGYTSASDIDANPLPRSSVDEVYAQIVEDVGYAYNNLPEGLGRFKFNQDAATVLKATVEMEMEMYAEARTTLEPLIGTYSLESDYASLFTGTASATETIFAIDFNETDGGNHGFFYLEEGRGEVAASDALINSFSEGDPRINQISETGEIIKYKDAGSGNDDAYVFRYAEVLLMYAEILARLDDPSASTYLNMVRERAGGLAPIELTSSNVVDVIAEERFRELYAESSDRLQTITRLGIADEVIQSKPGSTVFIDERDNLWPIPQQEIERNAAISDADQNLGY